MNIKIIYNYFIIIYNHYKLIDNLEKGYSIHNFSIIMKFHFIFVK
jgi:hypothetical protein